MRFDTASYSNIGGREVNEDSVLVKPYGGALLAAVADGLGGHGGGDVASQTALKVLDARCKEAFPADEAAWKTTCAALNAAVLAAQSERVRMKTTLALAAVYGETLACVHVGDSRVYYFHEGSVRYQSADHSVSQLAVLAGEITVAEIRFHEDRSRLLRSLGSEEAAAPDVRLFQDAPQPGDALLLCSDGFWEYVLEKEMLDTLLCVRSAQAWLDSMRRILKKRAKRGNDNNSAAAVRFLPDRKR